MTISMQSGKQLAMAVADTAGQQQAWLRLLRSPKLGAAALRRAVEHFDSAAALVDGSPSAWRAAGIDDDSIRALGVLEAANVEDLGWLQGPNRHLIGWDSEDYPALLRRGPNPPPALFVVGDPTLLWRPQVAVVGSRNPSPGGRDNAAAFARGLARDGWLVSSGLADGVDAAAHRAALDAGQPTLAVVGTGPDRVYPARWPRTSLPTVSSSASSCPALARGASISRGATASSPDSASARW